MKRHVVIKLLVLSSLLVLLFACSSKPVYIEKVVVAEPIIEVTPVIKGAPEWVNKGSHFAMAKEARLFWGVSSATPQGDLALQKALADDNARAEVARIFAKYMTALSRDYANSLKVSGAIVADEYDLQALQKVEKESLLGIRIIGSWRDQKSSSIWSIAELDLKQVKLIAAGMSDINAVLKQYIETMADAQFERIDRERHRERAASD